MAGYTHGATRRSGDVHTVIRTLHQREKQLLGEIQRLEDEAAELRRQFVAQRRETAAARWQARRLEHEIRSRDWTQADWDALLADIRARWPEPDEVRRQRLQLVTEECTGRKAA
ncbi:hypothetical protein [Zhihengliuella flava]|uniref:Septal ring factor EnvC (AmiA/AmiB activator) n=1 Tax=Zhihengliuella flava TaxID=1285193 RepID=A0A931GMX3_9MICC|nr:hypothetical protein [Zhihengliuella flava]MBG6085849.1 septal ring factor EnvC (AmiA/AmiB activator) [Zhihengliuella flava]